MCFYVLNVVDVGRHKAASEIMASKSAGAVTEALGKVWGRLGAPDRLQLDNQQALIGAGRRLGEAETRALSPRFAQLSLYDTDPAGTIEYIRFIRSDGILRIRPRQWDNVCSGVGGAGRPGGARDDLPPGCHRLVLRRANWRDDRNRKSH